MATWESQDKSGTGWEYGDANLTYGADNDPDTGSTVNYGLLGQEVSWTNQSKS